MNYDYLKLEIFVPVSHLRQIQAALCESGAGAFGNYDSVCSYSPVKGCWRALPGAQPWLGEIGQVQEADEYKIEVLCATSRLAEVVAAVKAAHPYEEPVIQALPVLLSGLSE